MNNETVPHPVADSAFLGTDMHRRHFVISTAATALIPFCSGQATDAETATAAQRAQMYGLIGKMKATPGQREALIPLLLANVGEMIFGDECPTTYSASRGADPC